jgi:hypothetical protein
VISATALMGTLAQNHQEQWPLLLGKLKTTEGKTWIAVTFHPQNQLVE